jgi:DNA/RNA endonuclease G (NUC1)
MALLVVRRLRNRILIVPALLAVALIIYASLVPSSSAVSNGGVMNALDVPLTENFDSLQSAAGTTQTWSDNVTIPGWYSSRTQYTAATGSSNSGALYSFGVAGVNPVTDRALGSIASGSTLTVYQGVKLTNNTGATITSLDISYVGEQWRNAGNTTAHKLSFEYRVADPGVITSIATGTWTAFNALDFTGPIATSTITVLDGNNPANRIPKSATLNTSVTNGKEIWLRWVDPDDAGADHGLAVDDFSVTPHGTAGDTAPFVASTSPLNNAINVPVSSDISLTFSEPVNVTGNWFQFACTVSGTKQVADTSVSGGPTTFTINPNNDFAPNEQCTFTVLKDQVSDQDPNDPPDTMASNSIFSFTVAGPPVDPGSVVISQVYGGGGNAGATFRNDFIEVINHTGSPINLNGWSVQYASAAGTTWQVTPLSGSLQPGQYYLIQEASGGGAGAVNPTADATGTINMSATNGKIALVNSVSALSDACPSDPSVIDFVGYGTTASCFEGSGPAPTLSATAAAFRLANGCTDTNDNDQDFTSDTPNPRNTSSATNNCAFLSGAGSASPASVSPGDNTLLTVNVTPGSNPTSTGVSVVADLSAIGGSATQSFAGNGNSFSYLATVANATSAGQKSLAVTITDAQSRTANTSINLTVLQPPPSGDHLVISQIYGGGGNTGAAYGNDFVELYNPGSSAVDLTGWSLQYAAFDSSGWGSNKQPLGGTIGSGEYYLIKLGAGTGGGPALPPANVEGVINLSGSTGKVALVSSFQPLSGTCPLADPNLVDFVGYGSTATTSRFCYEGTAPAPGPNGNNTVSVFRKAGGATDTNNNANDLITGAANPRRTAPIVELGPNVLSNDPSWNGFDIPHDASITVSFTEPVNLDAGWYNITCSDSSTHNDATIVVSNNSKTFVITPNTNFPFGAQCSVTISKDSVHDQDTDDSGSNSDTLPFDYSWTFTIVGAGQPAPYPPSVHLTMGNPSNAVADTSQFNNYLMEKPTYSLSYNRDKGTPNWVSWHLEPAWFGSLARFDTFRPDPAVPADWYRVQATDYSGSGFDRGHMTPNADRDNENRKPINQETYLMSNMVPQAPDNNQGPWAAFENYLRSIVSAPNNNEVYIVSGPLGVGGSGANGGTTTTVGGGHVTVPAFTWKVVLVIPIGDNDVSRVTAATRTIAIMMPNQQGIRNTPWQNFRVTVDQVEQATGYDFFANVPDTIENAIEAGFDGDNPPGTENQSATTAEDNPVQLTVNAVSPNANPAFTYNIVSGPTHGNLTGTGPNFTYTPAADFNGSDSFTFNVNDGSHTSNTSTMSINVTEVNDAPTAVDDNGNATDEDTQLAISATSLSSNDSAGPADEGLQTLTVTNVSNSANTHGSVTLDNGTITYTPDANYHGPASFTYQVCDNGTTNGAPDSQCATATVNITVNSVNDNPVAVDDSAATDEDTSVTIDVVANDTDVDGDTRTLQSVGTASHGSVSIVSGQAQYSPAANFHGSDSFTYVVSDGHGGEATGTVNITVNSVNDNPVAGDDAATTNEDMSVLVDVVANDTDVDGDTRTLHSVGTASHGSVSIVGGQAQYSPAQDFNGSDSFTYVVSDGHGGEATGTVNITVNPVNDNPVAVNDSATTNEDTPVTMNVVANDTDVDGDTRTLQSVGTASHGSVSIVSGQAQYSPAADFNGSDSFTYVVSDGHGGTATGTVNVTVNPVNDAPVLTGVPATASVVYSTNLSFTAQATDIDLPAQALTFSLFGAPSGATINPTSGAFSWTPTAAQASNDGTTYNFNVAVSDGVATTFSPISVQVQLKPLTSLGPAQVWLGVKTGGDAGTKFDLLVEVLRNGALVGSGQLNDAAVGGVNVNSALQQTINLAALPSTGFRTGDVLSIRLSARIATSSPNKNGAIRLWYNDVNVNSNFAATIGDVANNYSLRSGSVLTTTPGTGPTESAEVALKRAGGNPFTSLGTWSITY